MWAQNKKNKKKLIIICEPEIEGKETKIILVPKESNW